MNAAFLVEGLETQAIDYRVNRYKLGQKFANITDFDIFFLQRGDEFPHSLVEAIQRPRIFYFSELLSRRHDADHLFKSNIFDYYFVRGLKCRQELIRRGWVPENKIGILLSAFDPQTYHPIKVEKNIDVLFIGADTPRRQEILGKLSRNFDVTIGTAYGRDASILYNHAKVILNIHAEDYLDTETRVYEVLGSGGFLITEKLAPESPFRSGTHLIEVGNLDDLALKIGQYLHLPEEREIIAAQGYQEASTKHTYSARAKEIMTIVKTFVPLQPWSTPALNTDKVRSFARSEMQLRIKRTARSIYVEVATKMRNVVRK